MNPFVVAIGVTASLLGGMAAATHPKVSLIGLLLTLATVVVARLRRKAGAADRSLAKPRAFAAAELWVLPGVLAVFPLYPRLATMLAGLVLTAALLRPRRGVTLSASGMLAVLALMASSLMVEVHHRPVLIVTSLATSAIAVAITAARAGSYPAVVALLDGVGGYLVINLAMYDVLGLSSPFAAERTGGLTNTSGGSRVFLPLAGSLNAPATFAAAYLSGLGLLFAMKRLRIKSRALTALAALDVLYVTDARAAAVIAAGLALLATLSPLLVRRIAVAVAVISMAVPFAFTAVTGPLSVGADLARATAHLGRADDSGLLNGRDAIWTQALLFFRTSVPPERQLIGYGPGGSQTSGASVTYSSIVSSSLADASAASAHSSSLEQLYDGGLIGITLWAFGLILLIRTLGRRAINPGASLAHVLVLALVVTGATEVSAAPGAHQGSFGLLLLLGIAGVSGRSNSANTASEVEGDHLDELDLIEADMARTRNFGLPTR